MTLDLSNTPLQPDVNSPKTSQLDSASGTEKFFDFVMRNIKELNESISQRHDLSKPKEGYVLYTRELTPSQAASRTSEGFIESLTKEKKVKIQECFVFVPEFSDALVVPTVEQISIFNLLRKSKRNPEAGDLDSDRAIDEGFTNEEKDEFLKKVEKKLLSAFRFYAVGTSIGIGISGCKVLFHDKNNLQFGKVVEITGPVDTNAPKNLKLSIKRAKRDLNMKGDAVNDEKRRKAESIKASLIAQGPISDVKKSLRSLADLNYRAQIDEAAENE